MQSYRLLLYLITTVINEKVISSACISNPLYPCRNQDTPIYEAIMNYQGQINLKDADVK